MSLTPADVEAARERLAGVARETPLYPSETFSRLTGRPIFLKAENLQRTGSFKIRARTTRLRRSVKRSDGRCRRRERGTTGAVAWAAREADRRDHLHARTRRWPRSRRPAVRWGARTSSAPPSRRGGGGRQARRAGRRHARTRPRTSESSPARGRRASSRRAGAGCGNRAIPIGGGGLAGHRAALKARRPDGERTGIASPVNDCRRHRRKHPGVLPSSISTASGPHGAGLGRRTPKPSSSASSDEASGRGAGAVGLAAPLAGRIWNRSVAVFFGGNIDATTLIRCCDTASLGPALSSRSGCSSPIAPGAERPRPVAGVVTVSVTTTARDGRRPHRRPRSSSSSRPATRRTARFRCVDPRVRVRRRAARTATGVVSRRSGELDGGATLRDPGVDAAVHDRVRVEPVRREDARGDRGARSRLADRHDRLVSREVGLAEREQAIGDVEAARDVARVVLVLLPDVDELGSVREQRIELLDGDELERLGAAPEDSPRARGSRRRGVRVPRARPRLRRLQRSRPARSRGRTPPSSRSAFPTPAR